MVEDRLDALLAQGEHLDAVAEIEASVADAPLRERRWKLLMTALYRSGRHAEALRAFQRARDLMITQLGLEPSEALRRLEAAILAQDPALDWRGALSAPWLTAPTGSPTSASEDALRAGDLAFRRGAPAEAVACYRRALTSAGANDGSLVRECEVLVRLAESEYLAGDPARRSTGVAAARLADHLGDRGCSCAPRLREAGRSMPQPHGSTRSGSHCSVEHSRLPARRLITRACSLSSHPSWLHHRTTRNAASSATQPSRWHAHQVMP